jgi:hypothetical protein
MRLEVEKAVRATRIDPKIVRAGSRWFALHGGPN